MYPQDDYEGAIHRLSTFLQQFWGGPRTYIEERGHPRLIKRHAAFKVNPDARDRWLGHMRAALDELALPPMQDATLWGNLDSEAHALVNTFVAVASCSVRASLSPPGPVDSARW